MRTRITSQQEFGRTRGRLSILWSDQPKTELLSLISVRSNLIERMTVETPSLQSCNIADSIMLQEFFSQERRRMLGKTFEYKTYWKKLPEENMLQSAWALGLGRWVLLFNSQQDHDQRNVFNPKRGMCWRDPVKVQTVIQLSICGMT